MNNNYQVITFGSAIVDFFLVSTDFQLKNNRSLICQPYQDKIEVDQRKIRLGGGGTNSAVSLARKGFKVGVVCRYGNDFLGQFITQQLKQEQVDLDFVVQKNEQTDSSVVLVGPDGGRTILISRGKSKLEQENIDFKQLESEWFYLASLEGNLPLAKKLLTYAQKNKIKVFWNPGKRELKQKEKIIPLIDKVDVFMVNRQEARMLLGTDLDKKGFWPKLKKLGSERTIVTDGVNGAYLQHSQGVYFLDAPKVDTVDQTGAGDAFGSGFLAGLLSGLDHETAFSSAMNNAVSVVQKIGAQTGLIKK